MSTIQRTSGLTRFLVLTAVGLVPLGFSCAIKPCLAHPPASQVYGGQDPVGEEMPNLGPFGQVPGDDDLMPRRSVRTKTARKKTRLAEKVDSAAKAKTADTKTNKDAGGSGQIKFSQDIAPILVANCTGCHSGDRPGLKRGKLDLTTFEKLQKGGKSDEPSVVAGKPGESHLVLRIKGEETPRMPQGNNNVMSADAIAKIEQWVKEGAKLDDGIDPKKPIKDYAASVDQVRRSKIAKLPPQERDKTIETVGLERWKLSGAKEKPEIARGENFILFSNLPSERTSNLLKVLDRQPGHLKRFTGLPVSDRVEKVSLFVFSSKKEFIEFVRSVPKVEVDADAVASSHLAVDQPYLAVVDPAGGKKEEPAAAKRKGRGRRNDDRDAGGPAGDRSLAGILTEEYARGTVETAGKPPRWLVVGIGSYFAAQVEQHSHRYEQLRRTAMANYRQGWDTKATNALGETEITADAMQAIGFALVEGMMDGMRAGFPAFVRGMVQEGNKLDETLQQVYQVTRDEFIEGTGEWVAAHYGNLE